MISVTLLLFVLYGSLPVESIVETSSLSATFSIVALDPETGELGIAVASKVPFVGHSVPWARAGSGAVATQAWVNHFWGAEGIDLLSQGKTADEVVELLVSSDSESEIRQIGVVDINGNSFSFTGSEALDWAGGVTGPGYAIQGNILTGEDVILEMEKAFLGTDGPLATRLIEALKAGEAAGGDSRGKQSAALLVVHEEWGHDGASDIFVDICVSDHADPIPELERLYRIWEGYNVFPVYIDAGKEPELSYALDILNRVVLEDDPDPDIYNYYAWTLAERGLFPDKAIELAETALNLAPDDHNIMDTLAEAFYASGDPEKAVEWETKALELDPDNQFYLTQIEKFTEDLEDN